MIFLGLVCIISKSNAQVNLQTGAASYGVSMLNWQDSKSRLNSVVSLNYSSGNGLKATSIASCVGTGWNLVAGGVISRMQVGEPDDQKGRDGAEDDLNKYPPGYLYNTTSPNIGCPNALTKYPIFDHMNQLYKPVNSVAADREKDYFSFQFNGRTGLFVLGDFNTTTGTGTCASLGESKLIMTFTTDPGLPATQHIRTTITGFTIQDENGLIYRFTTWSKTKVLRNSFCDVNATEQLTQPNLQGGNVYHQSEFDDNTIQDNYIVNNWYLTEIEDALTHRKIEFTYNPITINAISGTSITYYQEKNYAILSHKRSIITEQQLTNIDYPDGHHVQFNYGKDRIDMPGDQVLASVDINYTQNGATRNVSRFVLNTTYVIGSRYGTPVKENQIKIARLYLLSVTQFGADLKGFSEPYVFDYYLGSGSGDDIVPAPFSHLRDVWGFYNGDYSKYYNGSSTVSIPVGTQLSDLTLAQVKGLCFLSGSTNTPAFFNAKPHYAQNGLLKQVTYPTGGFMIYEYAQNTGVINGSGNNSDQTVGGVHVADTKVIAVGSSNDCAHPIITTYSYNLSGGSQSSLWGIEMPQNSIQASSHYQMEKKYWTWKGGLFGSCRWKFQYPGILSQDQSIDLSQLENLLIGLNEVLSMVSTVAAWSDVVTMIGSAAAGETLGISLIIAVAIDVILGWYTIFSTCTSDGSPQDNTTTVVYNDDINGSNPLPSQFKRVEVVNGSGSNGKTVMEYTSPDDYPIWEPNNTIYSLKQRFAYWAYGLPKKVTVYDASNNKVKETENVYDTTGAKSYYIAADNSIAYPSCKCQVKASSSQRNEGWDTPGMNPATDFTTTLTSNTSLAAEIYNVYTGKMRLKDVYERTYSTQDPSQVLESKAHYEYNRLNFQVSDIYTYGSASDYYEDKHKNIRYSTDFAAGNYAVLKANNIINEQVGTTEYVGYSNDDFDHELYMGEKITEYTQLPSGNVVPLRVLEDRTRLGQSVNGGSVSRGNIGFGSAAGYTTDPANPNYRDNYHTYIDQGSSSNAASLKETQTLSYDAGDNLAGLKDEGGHVIANLYGYNDKYIIASVINAQYGADIAAYCSFEDGCGWGGWSVSGISGADITASAAVTGNKALVLTSGKSIYSSKNTDKPYKLSFWSTASLTVSSGASLVKSAPLINGFTYYEYDVSAATSSVSISGTGTIDELRLYPANARMRTVSYDPLVGKTTDCDENNRLTYYEYDELSRLRFVKDDYKNIIKMNEYNTAKTINNCEGIYSNHAVSGEIYTKNDCGAGYIGSDVPYIDIPAGKYQSTISQEDADRMAQDELDNNAQAYANAHGTCPQLFYNAAISQAFTPQTCQPGYKPSADVVYTVPANKYSSTIPGAADAMAAAEIQANGQAYANAHANCVTDTDPDWQAVDPAQTQCDPSGNGQMQMLFTDMNPNSSTYNTSQWQDIGTSTSCPVTCYKYLISVNNSIAANVKIQYTPCGGTTTVAAWNTLSILTPGGSNPQYTYILLCLTSPPAFYDLSMTPYGTTSNITVINDGTCSN